MSDDTRCYECGGELYDDDIEKMPPGRIEATEITLGERVQRLEKCVRDLERYAALERIQRRKIEEQKR